ncbi:AMP-binding protein [Dactylosporangium sp. AC04546]|uniref:AMP-binding protein n=1 Tax=Dactylosporangium sp. AC04546 TaxID=2862460 RepID=UPI001EE06127|nr:AMP-binding protein [Dactylosporangium sp. AC04546]WVK88894.1 AMP-binding protein [Dactylosporangium sp. AC04546]
MPVPLDTRTVPFASRLAVHGDRTAVITADGELSYVALAEQVAAMARRLGERRRLVLLACANSLDSLVTYLAALAGGHPVLLVPAEHADALIDAYEPDVIARGGGHLEIRHTTSAHDLHPDLALLLSTSGSTGSPKLVRLSHENLQANAESIAEYLDIRQSDRAPTALPMHYCYGLSVVNSHLLRGAGLILTDRSVTDPGFWELFRTGRGTSLAGVPYTFDLLDRVGFAGMSLPGLRYVTQAGGRLAPERVAHYAATGRRRGWKFFVMYGQTEATARMAYLPPDLAEAHPAAIGVPVPGGAFRLDPVPDQPGSDTGELVYCGPNVMLGYAGSPADLALGRTVDELRTGDVARCTTSGLYEIVGRRSGFVKIFGLRIDPHRVEHLLAQDGIAALCRGDDSELVVATTAGEARVRRLVARHCGLPARAVRVHRLAELPRLPNGKPDYQALGNAVGDLAGARPAPARADLCQLYAEILDHPGVTPDDSFVRLGGDSLSYVEMSIRLEQALGTLPADWHTLPIRELTRDLTGPAPRPASRWRKLDTTVALRAIAIVLIVGSHIPVFMIKGGAHLLLAVAGYNFARFTLTSAARRLRARHLGGSVARIAVPSMAWIALAVLLTADYAPANIALLSSIVGQRPASADWHFWFVEAIVYILLAMLALTSIPAVDRTERRFPFATPMLLMAAGLVTRYDLPNLAAHGKVPPALVVFWLFALGWAAAKATTTWQRLLVTAATLATVPGFFGDPQREALVAAGLVLLVWVPTVPSLASINRVAGILASSSLYIYLAHWQVFPRFDDVSRHLALVASLAVGIAFAAIATRTERQLAAVGRRLTRRSRASVRD